MPLGGSGSDGGGTHLLGGHLALRAHGGDLLGVALQVTLVLAYWGPVVAVSFRDLPFSRVISLWLSTSVSAGRGFLGVTVTGTTISKELLGP